MPDTQIFVGIDWGSEAHQVCVLEASGRVRFERRIVHSGPGLAALVAELRQLAPPGRIAVALEVPRGALVDGLLEHGFEVVAINPKQLDRFRDRHTVAGAKDDRRDAFVLADALRTDRAAFRPLQTDSPLVIQLRELSRVHADLEREHTQLSNRLREQLHRFYPQLLAVCPAADEPWLWSLLVQAPTPAAGQRQSLRGLRELLRSHRIRRFTPEALQAQLQIAPLPVAPGTAEAISAHISLLVPRLRLVHEQRAQCEKRLDQILAALAIPDDASEIRKHRDVTIIRSLPGLGRGGTATMLAEATRPLADRDYQTLRAHTGVAPVTRQSGKSRIVLLRRACNYRLRNAVHHWALNSIKHDAHARAHYTRLRGQGHGHPRALRGVADRLLGVLIAMLRTGTLYDPGRRQTQTA